MLYSQTTATKKIMAMRARIRAISGGASASKTVSIIMWLISYCQTYPNKIVSIVSETLPHLKRGAMRDFLAIMQGHQYYKDNLWNRSDFIYTFETGTRLEFFSADQSDKVRGPRRDVLFINEANNVPLETYTQLELRTRELVFLDWNPISEFWWYTDVAPYIKHEFLTLTYKDNEGLSAGEVQALEQHKNNPNKANWWKVYGEGQLGEATGRIYIGWQLIDQVPHDARLEVYGLDFGYTNDPTAIVAIYKYNEGYILHEVAYTKQLSNKQIADILLNLPRALVIADSAEPKSIDEIAGYGVNIVPALKGQGSIKQGIQFVQDQRLSITKDSLNVLKEYRNYLWLTDPKTDKPLNEPSTTMNHAMDAIRYGFSKNFIELETEPAYNPPDAEYLNSIGITNPYGGIEGYAGVPFGLPKY